MSLPVVTTAYSKTAICLHWLIAILIVLNFSLGLSFESYEGTATWQQILFYHGSIGSLIFVLAIYRYLWRLTHQPPVLPAGMPNWEKQAAHVVHGLLYLLMILIPFTGYLYRTAAGHAVTVFGLFDWPMIVEKNFSLRLAMLDIHKSLVWILAILVVGHISAALKHQLIDRDNLLARMLPMRRKRP